MAINTVSISGRLGRDSEYRQTQSGTAIVSFDVAVTTRQKQGGEWVDKANWVPCVMYGNYATAMSPSLTKGRKVSIQGRLNENSWTTQDGQKRTKLEVIVEQIEVLEQITAQPYSPEHVDLYGEDVPF